VAKVVGRQRSRLVDPNSHATEPFRELRLALELRPESRTGNTIVFTSADAGAGKSTLAANYALVAADDGLSVLLVDGDFRGPSLHEFFEVPRAPGLVELLSSDGQLTEFTHQIFTGDGDLELLTAGAAVRTAGHVASSSAMARLLDGARARFDVVVIDAPPALASADATGLASHRGNDLVVVVRPSGQLRVLKRALRKLELIDANVVGLVVNGGERQSVYSS
jgi:capsular exopolysaccharide synthesis family protein